MKSMFKNIFYLFLVFFLLSACQSLKDGLTGKKQNNQDEFLVEKKNPLVLPPNYNELPIPNSETLKEEKSLSFDINLKTESLSKNRNILQEESSSTEQTILKNIKKNDSN